MPEVDATSPRLGSRAGPWRLWWPAGLLLSASLFAVTYLKAWSDGPGGAHVLFWLAGAVMLVTLVGLIAAGPSRTSGFLAAASLGVLLYLPKLLHSPVFFNYFDEASHVRAVEQLNSGAGLFLENPLNKAVEFYPGLAATAGSLVSATGLSTFEVGNVLILTLHALLLAALFLLYERITASARIALLAVAVYASNPAFVFFDSYFAYESFALPLAASALAAVVLSEDMSRRTANVLLGAVIALCLTVALTHHVTSWILGAILLALAVAVIWSRGWSASISKRLFAAGALTVGAVLAWLLVVAPYTYDYIYPTIEESFDAIGRVLGGNFEHRELFVRSTVPIYEKYATYAAVVILGLGFGFAVLSLLRHRAQREQPFTTAFAVVGATYFASLPIAFLISNSAVTRVWEFAFLGVAPLVALSLARLLNRGRWWSASAVVALLAVIFIGGVNSRTGLEQGLPGPYQPSADPRSMTRDVLAASEWMRSTYGRDNQIMGDRTAFAVFGAYGGQTPVSGQATGAQPWRVFFPRTVTPGVLSALERDQVRFLVVDRRVATELPRTGWYFSSNEPGAGTREQPIAQASLEKFADSRFFDTVYDNGNVVIYEYLDHVAERA